MIKHILYFLATLIVLCVADQQLKELFLLGFRWDSSCISLILAVNRGVAFSMLSFLGEYLKYIQIFLVAFAFMFITARGYLQKYWLPLAFILGGGVSNIYDRFLHGGVIDYIYWHCYFDFAIFNFADIMINIGVGLLLIDYLFAEYQSKKSASSSARKKS